MNAQERREGLVYAFGHLVSSYHIDANSAASGELALDVLEDLGIPKDEIERIEVLAEQVAGNYEYTGESDKFYLAIKRGEV